ncbi:unnamed protein product [Clonostachys rhizophaga]|uniref:Cyanovirin-N domain-containing protein n=1 Tax=Clonostachys rhizophaga TaxID=160324 RepID=A0A9N9V208_9HYPO|nr:unnamed protein product [Clonostachys rhizophaga]
MSAVMLLLLVTVLISRLAIAVAVPLESPFDSHANGASPAKGNENTTYSSKMAPSHKSVNSHSATADISGPAAVGSMFNGLCRQVSLGGLGQIGATTLSAQCVDGAGQWWDTSLNLNRCMGNEGGRLIYKEHGNFNKSCRLCVMQLRERGDPTFKCKCIGTKGIWTFTSIHFGIHSEDQLTVRPIEGRLAEIADIIVEEARNWPEIAMLSIELLVSGRMDNKT